jgi:hypothetical protein
MTRATRRPPWTPITAGDYLFKGADLGVLVTKGRLQTDDPSDLTPRCRTFIDGIHSRFLSQPLSTPAPAPPSLTTSGL